MRLSRAEIPLNLPAGWDFAKVFGERPRLPAQPSERRADADNGQAKLASLKRSRPAPVTGPDTVTLPKTATDAELSMIAGAILLALSLLLVATNRRQRFSL